MGSHGYLKCFHSRSERPETRKRLPPDRKRHVSGRIYEAASLRTVIPSEVMLSASGSRTGVTQPPVPRCYCQIRRSALPMRTSMSGARDLAHAAEPMRIFSAIKWVRVAQIASPDTRQFSRWPERPSFTPAMGDADTAHCQRRTGIDGRGVSITVSHLFPLHGRMETL